METFENCFFTAQMNHCIIFNTREKLGRSDQGEYFISSTNTKVYD